MASQSMGEEPRHRSVPLFQLGQTLIIDLSRVKQWHYMYEKKYIVAPQRYAVARFVMDSFINDQKYWIFTLYSSAHMAYTMTLPIPTEEWELAAAPEPFNERKVPFLAHAKLEPYDMGRVISVEFLYRPHDALKRYNSFASGIELFVQPVSPFVPHPDGVSLAGLRPEWPSTPAD